MPDQLNNQRNVANQPNGNNNAGQRNGTMQGDASKYFQLDKA